MPRLLVLLLLVAAAACQSAPSTLDNSPDSWPISEDTEMSIGVDDGDPDYILFRVYDAHVLDDGGYLISVSSASELRVYDQEGVFVRRIGRQGAGPGEYGEFESLYSWRVPGGGWITADGMQRRFHRYGPDGELAQTVSPELPEHIFGNSFIVGVFPGSDHMLGMTANGGLGAGREEGEIVANTFQYYRLDGDGGFVADVLDLPSRRRVVNVHRGVTNFPFIPFDQGSLIAPGPDYSVYVLPTDSAVVRRVGFDGSVLSRLTWNPPRVRVDDDLYARYSDSRLAGIDDPDRREQTATFLAREMPIPEWLPTAQAMQLDRLGLLWIERYRLSWDEEQVFDVLDPDAGWVATVTMPCIVRVFDVGEDYVLGRTVDAGVERVVRYGLSRSAGS